MFGAIIGGVGLILFPFRPDYFPDLDLKLRYTVAFLLNIAFAGLLCILGFHLTNDWKRAALSILSAVALFAVGSLLGFILALPRMSTEPAVQQAALPSSTEELMTKVSPIGFNNNLVDISDWITKSILALSIANYRDLIPTLQGAAAYLALDNTQNARTEAMVIVVGYASLGILYAYISTRTIVTSLLFDSSSGLGKDVVKTVEAAGRGAVKALDSTQEGDEPRRQTDSITPHEKETASAIAAQTADVPTKIIKAQLDQLARDYADVRSNQKPGAERTAAMEEIAGKMRALSIAALPLLNELKVADQAGLRLAAVSILEIKPSASETDWLVGCLSNENPFIGYHAALALREIAATIPCSEKQTILRALEKAKFTVPQSSDRADVVNDAGNKLAQRCPN